MTTTNKPAHHIRLRKVEATIWPNSRTNGPAYTVTLQRVYQDAKGDWKGTSALSLYDLPIAVKVLDLATDWIIGRANPASEATAGE